MNNSVMVDSSILIEYIKGNKTKLFNSLINDEQSQRFINETVVSEFLFQYIKVVTEKAPKTLQQSGRIPAIMRSNNRHVILEFFDLLPSSIDIYTLVPAFMQQYNLLPNDAIILATCKIHGITQLATHNSDFDIAAPAEGIQVLKEDS